MTRAFRRFAGACALLAALAGVVFTVAFAVVVQNGDRWAQWVSWVTLLVGGLVTIGVMVAFFAMLGEVEPQFALVGLIVGVAGALGASLLLLVVYVGRLTVMNPKTNVIRVAALASGLIVVPGFYLVVGRALLAGERPTSPAPAEEPG